MIVWRCLSSAQDKHCLLFLASENSLLSEHVYVVATCFASFVFFSSSFSVNWEVREGVKSVISPTTPHCDYAPEWLALPKLLFEHFSLLLLWVRMCVCALLLYFFYYQHASAGLTDLVPETGTSPPRTRVLTIIGAIIVLT